MWGLGEATIFFIVPDVWLTIAAKDNLQTGIKAALYALAGALLGGTVIYFLGRCCIDQMYQIFSYIPGINLQMIDRVAGQLHEYGLVAIVTGPVKGIPYKIYALQSANAQIGLLAFLAVSVPARLIRFLISIFSAHYTLKAINKLWPAINKITILLIFWTAFYIFYFSVI